MNECNKVKPGMEVLCSCGTSLGRVDQLMGDRIKLSPAESGDTDPHYVPNEWVERVDRNVMLNRNSEEVEFAWADESLAV
jgi:hypothetical protein